jgi:hypothetical protein
MNTAQEYMTTQLTATAQQFYAVALSKIIILTMIHVITND